MAVFIEISTSLDGYAAGPGQGPDQPLGRGGERLHDWVTRTSAWRESHGHEGGEDNRDGEVIAERLERTGATVMGRNMFGGGPGPWQEDWKGWWGDEPPFGHSVFVVTHHPREPLEMEGGTTFTFVTDGVDAAVGRAREAAGDKDVLIAGGANVCTQAVAAGLVDEIELHVVPLLFGSGERLFDGLPAGIELERTRVIDSPGVTHLRYAVKGP